MSSGLRSSFVKFAGVAAGALLSAGCAQEFQTKSPYQTQGFDQRFNTAEAPHATETFENRFGQPTQPKAQAGAQAAPAPAALNTADLLDCAQLMSCAKTLPPSRQPAAFTMISAQQACNAAFERTKDTPGAEADRASCYTTAISTFTTAMDYINTQEQQAAKLIAEDMARERAAQREKAGMFEPVAATPLDDGIFELTKKAVCQRREQEIVSGVTRNLADQEIQILTLACPNLLLPIPRP